MDNKQQQLSTILLLSNFEIKSNTNETFPFSSSPKTINNATNTVEPASTTTTTAAPSPSSSSSIKYKAGYLTFHPERQIFLPLFHPLTSIAWKSLHHLIDFAIVTVKSDVFLLGGFDVKMKKVKRDILRYDLREGRWLSCTKLLERRFAFTPFVFDNKIFCAGGYGKDKKLLNSVEYYEPMMNVCYYDQPLPYPCARYGVATSSRAEVFLIGGIIQTPSGVVTTSKQFLMFFKRRIESNQSSDGTVITMEWISIPGAQHPSTIGISRHECAVCSLSDRLFCIGGIESVDTDNPTMMKFHGLYYADIQDIRQLVKDPSSKTTSIWRTRHIPQCERIDCTVHVLNNKLFIIGGLSRERTLIPQLQEDKCDVGFYDWKRKLWFDGFPLQNCGMNTNHVKSALVQPNANSKEIEYDRFNWMLQWPLW